MINKKQRIFYHVTTEEAAKSIQKEGLVSKLGSNSLLAEEMEPAISLCDYKSIAYWSIVLDAPVVLKVTLEQEQYEGLERYSDTEYNEYVSWETIPPECIIRTTCPNKRKAMREECISMIINTGKLCSDILDYRYLVEDDTNIDDLCLGIRITICVLKRLDWSCLSPEEIKMHLLLSSYDHGSILDKIAGEEMCRVYQKISADGSDKLQKAAQELTACIEEIFADFLECNTKCYVHIVGGDADEPSL